MEKPHRVAQIYGYIVCLVSVITFIICVANIVPSIIDLQDPMHAGSIYSMQNSPSLASFENYKMDILKSGNKEGTQTAESYIPDEKTLQIMYEAAKSEKIQQAEHVARRSIIVDSIIIIISIMFFTIHWIWMRRLTKTLAA